jgi:hypothetical protein
VNFRVRLQSDYAVNNAITVPLKLFIVQIYAFG